MHQAIKSYTLKPNRYQAGTQNQHKTYFIDLETPSPDKECLSLGKKSTNLVSFSPKPNLNENDSKMSKLRIETKTRLNKYKDIGYNLSKADLRKYKSHQKCEKSDKSPSENEKVFKYNQSKKSISTEYGFEVRTPSIHKPKLQLNNLMGSKKMSLPSTPTAQSMYHFGLKSKNVLSNRNKKSSNLSSKSEESKPKLEKKISVDFEVLSKVKKLLDQAKALHKHSQSCATDKQCSQSKLIDLSKSAWAEFRKTIKLINEFKLICKQNQECFQQSNIGNLKLYCST